MLTRLQGWCISLSLLGVLIFPLASSAQLTTEDIDSRLNTESHVGNLTGHASSSTVKYDYRRYCVGCHGDVGDGNGEVAQWLDPPMWPKPRDFQLGIFKCRSTPTGTLPTDQDLYDTIGRGLDRSAMPIWNVLTKQERVDLVAWVKHFSPRFVGEKPGAPIPIPTEPEVTPERVKAGQDVFARVQCWKCHGVTGQANGPSASTLTDDQGRAIAPYNFSDGSRPKCGSTDQDIYRIFMTGLDGTPMPSFADNIKPDEAWDLVFFLRTLQPNNEYNKREKEIAQQLNLKPLNALKLSQ